jgi:hypothetical protein
MIWRIRGISESIGGSFPSVRDRRPSKILGVKDGDMDNSNRIGNIFAGDSEYLLWLRKERARKKGGV